MSANLSSDGRPAPGVLALAPSCQPEEDIGRIVDTWSLPLYETELTKIKVDHEELRQKAARLGSGRLHARRLLLALVFANFR